MVRLVEQVLNCLVLKMMVRKKETSMIPIMMLSSKSKNWTMLKRAKKMTRLCSSIAPNSTASINSGKNVVSATSN